MSDPEPPADPTAAELAALRKEKADREKADRDRDAAERAEEQAELKRLRDEKTAREAADAKKVQPPKAKKDKETGDPATPPANRKARVSARWFGDAAYDD